MVRETKDGKDFTIQSRGLTFRNPKEVLKDYKILDYIHTLKEKEIQSE